MTDALPAAIGDHRIERLLGTGTFGSVYAASTPRGDRVAIKCLHREGGAFDADLVARFHREAALCRSLVSPHIVQVFDHGVDPAAGPYLVMRLLRGVDLAQWIEKRAPLSPPAAVCIGIEVCRGLALAQSRGVVHRDLKPENVFLDHAGAGDLTAVVCDFGLAKICDENGKLAAAGLTSTGATLGTPFYMSPEQLIDAKRVDARTDVWAVGMILYTALAGQPALAHVKSFSDLVFALSGRSFKPLAEAAPWVPPPIAAVVASALAPLDTRCRSAADLERALLACCHLPDRLRASGLVKVVH